MATRQGVRPHTLPAEQGRGTTFFHRLDAGGMLMCARKTVTCLWRFLAHANSALTCEGDVAVSPLEPKGDVGDAGEISEG